MNYMNKANRIYIDRALLNTNYRLYGWKIVYNEVKDLSEHLRQWRKLNNKLLEVYNKWKV